MFWGGGSGHASGCGGCGCKVEVDEQKSKSKTPIFWCGFSIVSNLKLEVDIPPQDGCLVSPNTPKMIPQKVIDVKKGETNVPFLC